MAKQTTIQKVGQAVAGLVGPAPRKFEEFPEWREAHETLARARKDARENERKIEELRQRFQESIRTQASRDARVKAYLDGDPEAAKEALPPLGDQSVKLAVEELQARDRFYAEAIRVARERLENIANDCAAAIWRTVRPEYRTRVQRVIDGWAALAADCDDLRLYVDSLRPELALNLPTPLRVLGAADRVLGLGPNNPMTLALFNDHELRDLDIETPPQVARAIERNEREAKDYAASLAAVGK